MVFSQGSRNKVEQEKPKEDETVSWDIFEDVPRKPEIGSTASTKVIDTSVLILRGVTLVVTFVFVLGCAVLSKGTLLFMTSQIKHGTTRYYCKKLILDPTQQFTVTLPVAERVAWIWMLIFAYFLPELGTFYRSVRICIFKSVPKLPTKMDWLILSVTEILPAVGSALLVFVVLPELDVVKGAMLTNGFCFIPGLVAFLSRNPKCPKNLVRMILDVCSLSGQVLAFVVWPLVERKPILYTIPVAILLISVGWWENFVSVEGFFKDFAQERLQLKNKTYYMYRFIAPAKCAVFLLTAFLVITIREGDASFMFDEFGNAMSSHNIIIEEVTPIVGDGSINFDGVVSTGYSTVEKSTLTPIWVFIINILSTYVCYAFGKFTCKILMQTFSFAFPINLTVPVLLAGLIGMCGAYSQDVCAFDGIIPNYLFFNQPPIYFLDDFIGSEFSWVWLIWLLSQTWITIHIWTQQSTDKLASTELLFYKPMYDAYLIDQSLSMNRRRNPQPEDIVYDKEDDGTEQETEDHITRIYACGTMWHETREEMMEFLKSVMRLDADQFQQRKTRQYFNNPNYYEIETHIFFDDAFIRKSKEDNDPHLNSYVIDLIGAIDEAAAVIHKVEDLKLEPPQKTSTPYGGRLVWTMLGGNKIIAHLKDKARIRPKKRWSQVMYMYYLLGYKLAHNDKLSLESKQTRAHNTYILALDGDIDFQPKAVHLLVDYMKKNKALGAACGRIHPIGSGAMAWYQTFEYAVGHWLQKATEHVIGCVLCSPGCFSLFRGSALMANSVMKKYTTVATEPIHYVQYDQGEDRWLCTLLLQQGFRVEYSAASDSYTHCPEGFNEFYNQRRRWMPSTTANIIDLLQDSKHTMKVNDNISMMYIFYQIILLIGTVLGPGTIFLMLVGSFVAAFKLDQWSSFGLNLVPIMIFVLVCATCKSDTQLFFAAAISAMYGLVMMAVLLGVMMQIKDDGFLAPSSLFFFVMAGEFIITALLHPSEFYCLKYGVIYYVTVPSMYLLLVIYSVFNMNNVSWGTREVTVVKEPQQGKEPAETAKEKTQTEKVLAFLGADPTETEGSIDFSVAGLFRVLCCTHRPKDNEQLIKIQLSLEQLNNKLEKLEKIQRGESEGEDQSRPRKTVGKRVTIMQGPTGVTTVQEDSDDSEDTLSLGDSNIEPNSWYYDEGLEAGKVHLLGNDEKNFWKDLIAKYLEPIDETLKKEENEKNLRALRDKVVFTFFMLNSLFVLIVFLLTLEKETLHLDWPINPKVNFTYVTDRDEIQIQKTYLMLEPIGFVFLIFFALLLVIQFFAMLIHRFGTYTQIIANTELKKTVPKNNDDSMSFEQTKELIAENSKITQNENEKNDISGRRKTALLDLVEKKKTQAKFKSMDEAYEKRMEENEKSGDEKIKRQTMFLNKRRQTMIRQSMLPNHPMNKSPQSVPLSKDLTEDSNI